MEDPDKLKQNRSDPVWQETSQTEFHHLYGREGEDAVVNQVLGNNHRPGSAVQKACQVKGRPCKATDAGTPPQGQRLSGTNRLKILRVVAQPIAFYGKEVWVTGPKSTQELAMSNQSGILRRCWAAPWFVHDLRRDAKMEDKVKEAWDSRFKMEEGLLENEDEQLQEIGLKLSRSG